MFSPPRMSMSLIRPGDADVAVGVHRGEVAGVHPSGCVDGLGRPVRLPPVSEHDGVPAGADLPGTQYLSAEFASFAASLGVRHSVGRTGCCYDNAWAESFNGTLKNERVHRTSYPTREHARVDITRYIELRYNQIRLHSALGYRTPNEVEWEWLEEQRAA